MVSWSNTPQVAHLVFSAPLFAYAVPHLCINLCQVQGKLMNVSIKPLVIEIRKFLRKHVWKLKIFYLLLDWGARFKLFIWVPLFSLSLSSVAAPEFMAEKPVCCSETKLCGSLDVRHNGGDCSLTYFVCHIVTLSMQTLAQSVFLVGKRKGSVIAPYKSRSDSYTGFLALSIYIVYMKISLHNN